MATAFGNLSLNRVNETQFNHKSTRSLERQLLHDGQCMRFKRKGNIGPGHTLKTLGFFLKKTYDTV